MEQAKPSRYDKELEFSSRGHVNIQNAKKLLLCTQETITQSKGKNNEGRLGGDCTRPHGRGAWTMDSVGYTRVLMEFELMGFVDEQEVGSLEDQLENSHQEYFPGLIRGL